MLDSASASKVRFTVELRIQDFGDETLNLYTKTPDFVVEDLGSRSSV